MVREELMAFVFFSQQVTAEMLSSNSAADCSISWLVLTVCTTAALAISDVPYPEQKDIAFFTENSKLASCKLLLTVIAMWRTNTASTIIIGVVQCCRRQIMLGWSVDRSLV